MKQFVHIIMLGALLASGVLAAKNLNEQAEAEIHSIMSKVSLLSHSVFIIPTDVRKSIEKKVKQVFLRETVDVWRLEKDGELKGIAILDHVMGKTQPFSFLVIFDTWGSVESVRVIKYREQYGGGVQSKKFLRQFEGKNRESTFVIGKDIDGVSGATISTYSISRGIEKLVHLAPFLLAERNEK